MRKMNDSGIEWIGNIPENWTLTRLQYCLDEIKVWNNPVKTEQVLSLVKDKGVMPYAEKGDIGNKAKTDISEYKLAYPNTLVVNSMNILIGSVGLSNYFGCVSPVYYVFQETDSADLRFINYIFNTKPFQKELRKYANGILEIRLRVSADDIFKRKIPLPSKTEQRAIADYLDEKCREADALAAEIREQIDTLERYKRSLIAEKVTKGLDPNAPMKDSGIEWIGKVPEGWKAIKLKRIVTLSPEKTAVQKSPYIGLENIISWNGTYKLDTQVTPEGNCSVFHKGDILFGKLRPYLAKCVLIDFDGVCSEELLVFTDIKCNDTYLKYFLLNKHFIDVVNSSTFGTKMPRANWDFIGNQVIMIPPLPEQRAIADYLDEKCGEADSVIEQKRRQLEVLEEYKKSLIYEYVTGKKEVPAL